ncbi:MAG: hypothetical protein NZM26_05680, partial [Patescibacteria group bacterium]|nr:hypothetical protein [Patescibacteria group bacterium]
EYAINIGSGWDSVLRVGGTEVINGSGQVIAGRLTGTIFNSSADSGSGTLLQGETVSILGGTNGIDTTLSGDTWTLNLDTTEIGTTTFGSGTDFTWTFNSSGATDPTIAFGNNSQTFTTGAFNVTSNATTTNAISFDTNTVTTGTALRLLVDGLTTGTGFHINDSTAAGLSSGTLLHVSSISTALTSPTNGGSL